jgi:CheY-like chemotaxis protein
MQKTVLIVDDLNAETYKLDFLQHKDLPEYQSDGKPLFKHTFTVLCAYNKVDAKGFLDSNADIDLFVIDYDLGPKDPYGGREFVRTIKSTLKYASVPIIVITAVQEERDKELIKLGVDDYIIVQQETAPSMRLLYSAQRALEFADLKKTQIDQLVFQVTPGGRGSKYTLTVTRELTGESVSITMGEIAYGDLYVCYNYNGPGGASHPLYDENLALSATTPSRIRKKLKEKQGNYNSCPSKFAVCPPDSMNCPTLCAKKFWEESSYRINAKSSQTLSPPSDEYWRKREKLFKSQRKCFEDFNIDDLPDYLK